MAPDSSLLRHQLGECRFGPKYCVLKAGLLSFLSLLLFAFSGQANAEKAEFPGALASLSPTPEPSKENSMTKAVPMPSEAPMGNPPVLWRNRIQIPIKEPLVQKYIRFYQGQGRDTFSDGLKKAKTLVPQMTEILESYGVPGEMVSIAFVESRFERHASYRGAGGYWQLLASTARAMGLRVDRWVDERRDPIKSTKAAAKYLRKLYEQYDSWLLALAAYNTGGGSIRCAAVPGRVKDGSFHGHRLPAHSMVYVSKVLAAMKIMREPEEYGFECPNYCKPKDFDPIMVKAPLNLETIAKWIDVPVSQLQELNPSLRQDAMPPGSGFALRLPSGSRDKFDLAFGLSRR